MGGLEALPDTHTQARDDGSGALRVEMVGLKETDSGWYWCAVGDLQAPVHLNITQPAASRVKSWLCTQYILYSLLVYVNETVTSKYK